MTEATVKRAAYLAGNAQSSPIRIGYEHHLIILRVVGAQKPFAGAIGRNLCLDYLGASDHEAVRKPRAHRFGNIGHSLERRHATMVNPVKNLFGPQLCRLFIQL